MWEEMGLVRVYTKPQGQQPDFTDPAVLSAVCPFYHLILVHTRYSSMHFNFSLSLYIFISFYLIPICGYYRIEVAAQLRISAITFTEIW